MGTALAHDTADHWPEMARCWPQLGSPLRPAPQDIAFTSDAVHEWARHRGTPRVLLLGVTPELYRLPWPEGTDLLAVDRSQAMIDTVWPGPKEAARCADWLAPALADRSRDIALCDGGLHLVAYPHQQRRLARVLRRVLCDRGLCILRLYTPPPKREAPEAVLQDLLAGRISSLNILKLRLGMSLLDSAEEGVELGTIWRAVHAAAPSFEALAESINWPLEQVLAINAYRGSTARYHFVTVDQVRGLFCGSPGGFEVRRLCVPCYELGEQCPTIVLQRCSSVPAGREPECVGVEP